MSSGLSHSGLLSNNETCIARRAFDQVFPRESGGAIISHPLSPCNRPVCYTIWRRGSASDVDATPFLAGCGSTFLWLRYALMLEDVTMTGVNVVGLSAFSCYVLFYYAMSSNRNRISLKIFALISILTAIVLLCSSRGPDAIFWSAICACSSTMVSCASPLATLKRVLRTKSCESLPFAFIVFSFLNSVFWSWYGLLAKNNFIIFPNAVGGVIAFFQLLLFLVFPAGRSGSGQPHKAVSHYWRFDSWIRVIPDLPDHSFPPL